MNLYTIRMLNKNEIKSVRKLQADVIEDQKSSELFVPSPDDLLVASLEPPSGIAGIFHQDKLVAYSLFFLPPHDWNDNLGRDVGVSDNELTQVVHLEETVVHPEYRGRNLLHVILSFLTYRAITQNISHICATVSPFNYASLKSVFRATGMLGKKLRRKYGGFLRYIFHRDLRVFQTFANNSTQYVPANNIKHQKRLLEQGYFAFDVRKKIDEDKKEEIFIVFGKVLNIVCSS